MQPYVLSELELRHLVALQAVAAAGSFWEAAEQLGCSQSSLSQQIANVERIVGARLIERSRGRRVNKLTEPGRLLLRHAEAIVARLRAAHADFSTWADGGAGTLGVGTVEGTATHILPSVLSEFRQKWPGVDVQLTELSKDDALLSLLERGELDLSFAILPLQEGPFEAVNLLEDPYVLVVSSKSSPRERGPLTLADLRSPPLIMTGQPRSLEHTEAFIPSRGFELNVVFRSNYNATVQGLAGAGVGAGLCARLTVDERRSDTRILAPIRGL